ncbi:hypothetical protein [Streptomyces cinereoruber]|uniref:hypothetical protein n=1 Tax=Streptomyces cinereoruber TaxID=67260 RepID=UPI0036998BD3
MTAGPGRQEGVKGRTGGVKKETYGVRRPSTGAADGPERGFPRLVRKPPSRSRSRDPLHPGVTMADAAFVATTIALFALVAFIAKGVAKQ